MKGSMIQHFPTSLNRKNHLHFLSVELIASTSTSTFALMHSIVSTLWLLNYHVHFEGKYSRVIVSSFWTELFPFLVWLWLWESITAYSLLIHTWFGHYCSVIIFFIVSIEFGEVLLFLLVGADYPLISIHSDAAFICSDWLLYRVDKG